MKRFFCIQLFLLCSLGFAQTKPVDPPTLSAEQKVSVLTAQHKLDEVEKQMKDLDAQFQQVQTQAKARYQALGEQQTKQKAELDAAIVAAYQQAKAEQSKFDLDLDTLTFKPKPPAATADAKPPMESAKK
jgi:DNA repair ATPase RecN